MVGNPNHAPTVYSTELSSLGHGRPLWIPEPLDPQGEIELGDVGFVEEKGNFRRIFNILKEKDDPVHQMLGWGVPDNFTKLECHANLLLPIEDSLKAGIHKSTSVQQFTGEATAQGGYGSAGAGFSVRYSCSRKAGALLHLKDDAIQEEYTTNKRWPGYLNQNYKNWVLYLEASEFDISLEDLMIVRGFFKTSSWEAIAWTQCSRSGTVAVSAGAPAYLGVTAAIEMAREIQTSPTSRSYPRSDTRLEGADFVPVHATNQPPSTQQLPRNQTVFLSYYTIKRRIWFLSAKIKAEAGYDNLPPGSPGEYEEGSCVETESAITTEWDDPLDGAFRYIFERNTDAYVACVCDGDIKCLLQGQQWPNNLYEKLVELGPELDVIGDVAFFSVEDEIRRTHAPIAHRPHAVQHGTGPQGPSEPQSGDTSKKNSIPQEYEDIRGGSLTLADDQRTLEWRHTVLMDPTTSGGTPTPFDLSKDVQHVAVGFEDAIVRVWNVHAEDPRFTLIGHDDVVQCTAFSPDGQLLASGSSDCSIILWDLDSGSKISQVSSELSGIWGLAFSPDGKTLVSGSLEACLRFWDVEDIKNGMGESKATQTDLGSAIQAVAFTPDSSRVVSCSDNFGHIWDARSAALLHTMEGHEGTIWSLAISHNGARIATGSEDHTTRVWSMETGAELVTIREHRGAIWSVGFSPDDRYVISGSYDSTISISSASTGENLHILSGHTSVVEAIAYSPRGDLVASGAADGTIKLWDGKNGKAIAEMKGHADKIKCLKFSPNCDDLFSSSDDGTVRIWSTVNVLRVL